MNKISIYLFLLLIYLGGEHIVSMREGIFTINSPEAFAPLFPEAPLSVVLIGSQKTGLFFKTYYQRYRIIYDNKYPSVVLTRTSRDYFEQSQPLIGLSIFHRKHNRVESTLPAPPGNIFLGDPLYGRWQESGTEGEPRHWVFHRHYRFLNQVLGWYLFVPDEIFYQEMQAHLEMQRIYYGRNQEFGPSGSVTKKSLTQMTPYQRRIRMTPSKFLKKLIFSQNIQEH